MSLLPRIALPLALALSVTACSLGGLLGGGKVPPTLLTLTPQAPAPGPFVRSAAAGQTVTIAAPIVAKELRSVRVPAQVSPTDVAYIKGVQWVDTPDRLFRDLLAETVRRTTNRVVLDQKQSTLDPGVLVTGQLHRFGYDEATRSVIVRYDATLSTNGGASVQTRRFESSLPAAGDASAGPVLNNAANQVAYQVANWIGG